MSLHVLSHPWEVQDAPEGLHVTITPRDLDVETIAILTDELFELALETSPPTLYLDFGQVSCPTSVVFGKLVALERRLRAVGGRLVLRNLTLEASESTALG